MESEAKNSSNSSNELHVKTVIGRLANLEHNLTKLNSSKTELEIEKEKYFKEHAGHELMHFKIFIILTVSLIIGQILLLYWRAQHFKSYQVATLFFLYIFTGLYAFTNFELLGILLWIISTVCFGTILYLLRKPLINKHLPRKIYNFFVKYHRITTVVGSVFGFCGILLYFVFLLNPTVMVNKNYDFLFDFIFGVLLNVILFGLLNQDFASFVTEYIFVKIGNHKFGELPSDSNLEICRMCGSSLNKDDDDIDDESTNCDLITLDCAHRFHDSCIRGWCILGKKDTCPYCHEKCNLKNKFIQPWEKTELYYGDVLSMLRIIFAWNPIIFYFVKFVSKMIGLK